MSITLSLQFVHHYSRVTKIIGFLFSAGATVGNRYVNESFKLDYIDTLSNADDDNITKHNSENKELDISLAVGEAQMPNDTSEVQKPGSYGKQSR